MSFHDMFVRSCQVMSGQVFSIYIMSQFVMSYHDIFVLLSLVISPVMQMISEGVISRRQERKRNRSDEGEGGDERDGGEGGDARGG